AGSAASGGGGAARAHVAAPNPSNAPQSAESEQTLAGLGHAGHGPAGAKADGSHNPAAKATPSLPPTVAYDPTLQHPRSVFQLLKQQYSRYTPEMVGRITA